MQSEISIKSLLYKKCAENIHQRINTLEQTLTSIEEARNQETKSSAGDKYETGRAMMQIEEEKSRTQLSQALAVKKELMRIDISTRTQKGKLGSLVITNKGKYFISIGIGKVILKDGPYYCISRLSPIGTQLIGKEEEEEIEFNGNRIRIEEIW